ncbi:MAG: hypothetical protein WCS70_02440 [Verrucomicrobiota bacterium]
MKTVTDEEIKTALTVLEALTDELKAQTKCRIDRVPKDAAGNERAADIAFELRGNLISIRSLRLELKYWIKRRRNSK